MSKKAQSLFTKKVDNKNKLILGSIYFLICGFIIFGLMYVLPVILQIDIKNFFKSNTVLGLCRVLLGAALLLGLCITTIKYVNACTLEGETFKKGIINAYKARVLQRHIFTISIVVISSLFLIVWGINMMYFA